MTTPKPEPARPARPATDEEISCWETRCVTDEAWKQQIKARTEADRARIRELEAELADTRSQLAHEESKEFWPR